MRALAQAHLAGLVVGIVCAGAQPAVAQEVTIVVKGLERPGGVTVAQPDKNGRLTVDAGPVDARGSRQPRSGRVVRWRSGDGAFLVFGFEATVQHSGGTARLELQAVGQEAQAMRVALGASTHWDVPTAGKSIPVAGTIVVHPALQNGDTLIFEVALPLGARENPGLRMPMLRYEAVLNDSGVGAAQVVSASSGTSTKAFSRAMRWRLPSALFDNDVPPPLVAPLPLVGRQPTRSAK